MTVNEQLMPTKRRTQGLVLALVPLGFLWMCAALQVDNFDFEIYRNALLDVLRGGSVYDFGVPQPQLHTVMGFVYPPFASLAMLPLGLVPSIVGRILIATATIGLVVAALVACFRLVDSRRATSGRRPFSLITWAWVALPMAVSMSAIFNMQNGQVSFIVAALVLLDVLVLPPRWRGVMVGLAGAVKLTPMIMVPFFLVTRQWRAAANSCAAFGLAAAFAAVFRWSDSVRYWLHPGWLASSFGDLARVENWSIYGDLARLGLAGSTLTFIWVPAAALMLAAALWRARKHYASSQPLEAVLVMGIAATLVTSATWPHHLLFGLVACTLLAAQRPLIGTPALLIFTVAGYVFTAVIGFLIVALMIAIVIAGLPGDVRTTRRPEFDTEPDDVLSRAE
jgi:alpha-1,2-mannosyltransferase